MAGVEILTKIGMIMDNVSGKTLSRSCLLRIRLRGKVKITSGNLNLSTYTRICQGTDMEGIGGVVN